jgi:hypothetical protein
MAQGTGVNPIVAAFTVSLWHDLDMELERNAANPETILY